jgi:hypothetical protein
MKKATVVLILLSISVLFVQAQVIDSFSDGDFTSNPVWSGDTNSWEIVTDSDVAAGASNSLTLRLNGAAVKDTVYLSTQRTLSWGSQQSWSFWMGRRGQAATNDNHNIVWLWANEANLSSKSINGYRVKFGDNSGADEIVLQKAVNGSSTNIIASNQSVSNGLIDISLMVRITRTSASVWTLYTSTLPADTSEGAVATDVPSKANTAINQGSATDSAFTDFSDGYLGFMAGHSSTGGAPTGAEFDQLYFDTNSDASLPVELSSFSGKLVGKAVELTWMTQSEVNNHGFMVLRAESEKGAFHEISALIQGAGTSSDRREYTFRDERIDSGNSYWYQLKQLDFDGQVKLHGPIKVAAVENDNKAEVFPNESRLLDNYPNPFVAGTKIRLIVADEDNSPVMISIYDLLGRKVFDLVNKQLLPGRHEFTWEGKNQSGSLLPSGSYFCSMTTSGGGFSSIKLFKVN